MAGRIPAEFIRDLLDRIDVVDVVNTRVPLKKKGANHSACCPFHQEKTPSFTVSQTKQFFHCFGCGEHGNAIDFVMKFDHMEFVDAIEELAKAYSLEVPKVALTPQQQKRHQQQMTLHQHLEQATKFYRWHLRQPTGQKAVEYLKQRGITGEVAQKFALGYAPEGWEHFKNAAQRSSTDLQQLIQVGLLVKNDRNRIYDRFRDRIMFPIRDTRGRTIGFGSRTLDPEGQPKYLNSPETPVYHKGQSLYGIYEILQQQNTCDYIVVVEGYMDVIALAQFGVDTAVATLGTALTKQQLQQIRKYTRKIIFCFDGDRAGKEAAWRALNIALPMMTGDHQLLFLFLPEGEDPDSYIRAQGKDAFDAQLEQAIPFSDFLLQHFLVEYDIRSLDGRAQLLSAMSPQLRLIPEGNFLTLLCESLAKQLEMPVATILKATHTPKKEKTHTKKQLNTKQRAAAYLVQYPVLAAELNFPDVENQQEDRGLLYRIWHHLQSNPVENTGQLMALWPNPNERSLLAELAHVTLPLQDLKQIQNELQDTCRKLTQQTANTQLEDLIAKSRTSTLSDSEQQLLSKLLQRLQKKP